MATLTLRGLQHKVFHLGISKYLSSTTTFALKNKIQGLDSPQSRNFVTSFNRNDVPKPAKNWYSVTFEKTSGEQFKVKGKEGDNLLDIALNNDLDLEGYGACEGTLACSTCHLIFKEEDFNKISDPASDEELDMLDLAYGLSDTSRLGCQVCLSKELDGVVVKVPEGTADARNL